jgi:hypothetical protein
LQMRWETAEIGCLLECEVSAQATEIQDEPIWPINGRGMTSGQPRTALEFASL